MSSQVRVTGMGSIIGLDFGALSVMFEIYEIEEAIEKQIMYEKLRAIESVWLEEIRRRESVKK